MAVSEFTNDICRLTIKHALRANIGHEHEDPQNLRIQILEKALEGILELYI